MPSRAPSLKQKRTPPRSERAALSRLRKLLCERAFRYSEKPIFRLSSGARSRYYMNCKTVTLDPEGAALIGRLVYKRIKTLRPAGIGGLTLGADPIAVSTAIASHRGPRPVPAFIIRKEPKGHGSRAWIEGGLPRGAKVVVVEDVITTGASTLKAITRLRSYGCKILKVIALVDRGEGGREKIQARRIPVESLFTIRDFLPPAPRP